MRARDDTGLVTLQHLLVSPVLFGAFLICLQAAISFHATMVCRFAADAAVERAASADGTVDAARVEAANRLDVLGTRLFEENPTVTVSRSATLAEVRVSGPVYHLVPGLFDQAAATATQPVQRFRPYP